ncbi:FAD/FMN-containing dehydrogenase [Dethiosulfatibacter aminovorans DSM 17477]|uniref:Delta(24)-sterol reductase n=1 Tax=Dethiosulfatibacter aminovorans DSM 17477 TaxID=1121476 RepID=A0A1M6JNK9_9FIRM|nr:FAD-binding protein [Dethiosulfatibacter aminovorans]SHJ48232.1 FAD/FMN-containing dehydrogenase [Dethiosulfatibacter aminovorans DSM 17477]
MNGLQMIAENDIRIHNEKVIKIARQLKERKSTTPLSLKKKAVSHEVPKPNDKRHSDEKLDISDLDEVIHIDAEKMICIAEPGVTFEKLVEETGKHGLAPVVVPEHKTITIGGAVAGGGIESMSYKFGSFHDSCLEFEIVTAKGDVMECTPDNENMLLFQMVHWTFGTLGIITLLKFRLIPVKPLVKMTYEKFESLEEYKDAIKEHYIKRDIDFMDGIIHSSEKFVLCAGDFVDDAPYTHNYDWLRVYYQSTDERKEDYLKTPDYFFRYDSGTTSSHPKSFIGRLLFRKFINSNNVLKVTNDLRKVIPSNFIPITVDLFLPFSKVDEFMEWYVKEVNHFPLWCVPYKVMHKYEWLSDEFLENVEDELFLDIAIYNMKRENPEHYHRIIEEKLIELGAIKTLISTNLYSEEEFWNIWNKKNYDLVKEKTDPDNIFRGYYEKMCRTSRGLGR